MKDLIEITKSILETKGIDFTEFTADEIQMIEVIIKATAEALSQPPVSGSYSFVCQGCKCKVPNDFSIKTDGYCYLCDPNVTLEECLQDEYPKSWR